MLRASQEVLLVGSGPSIEADAGLGGGLQLTFFMRDAIAPDDMCGRLSHQAVSFSLRLASRRARLFSEKRTVRKT